MNITVSWVLIACNQHFAGLRGGRVDRSDWVPGGLGEQLLDVVLVAYSRAVFTEYFSIL